MSFKIAYASCDYMHNPSPGWRRLMQHSPNVFISQGDTPYSNGQATQLYGYTTPAFSAATTEAEALDKLRQHWKKPTCDALLLDMASRSAQCYYQPDDHEWADDNWDHTNTNLGGSFTTQALVNTHWDRVNKAITTFMGERWNNPTINSAGNTARPSGSLGSGENPSALLYGIRYFVADYDINGALVRTSIGPSVASTVGAYCRVIFTDCISYRSPEAATDNSGKVMFGAQQEAWFLATVAASSGIPFVLVSSTKKLWRGTGDVGDNSDTFGNYTTERQRILAAMQDTGVRAIWLSGDRHTPTVCETRVASGSIADMIDITACPISGIVNGVGTTYPELIWKSSNRAYGLLTIDSTLNVEIRNSFTGSVMWSATFNSYSNAPVYSAAPLAARL